jgi:hypothetical protein
MTLYMANPMKNLDALRLMHERVIGYIDTPGQGRYYHHCYNALWCADNGCFGSRWQANTWWRWLRANNNERANCLFATAPDVVGDAAATLELSRPWLPRIRALGYPVAFVAQDGIEQTEVPWDEFDCLFIGGTTEFKLGRVARDHAREAKARGKWLHCGRVNSGKRYRYSEAIGSDSADGTFLLKDPTTNVPRMLRWLADLQDRPAMFDLQEELI